VAAEEETLNNNVTASMSQLGTIMWGSPSSVTQTYTSSQTGTVSFNLSSTGASTVSASSASAVVINGGASVTYSSAAPVTFNVPSTGSYSIVVPTATAVTLTGGGSGVTITINAPNANVTNNAAAGTVVLQDPLSFTNAASISTLQITQYTTLTVTNNGTVSAVQIAPTASANGVQYKIAGTAPGSVTLTSNNVAGATIAVPSGVNVTPTTAVTGAYNTATVSSDGVVGSTTSVTPVLGKEALPPSVISAVYTAGTGTVVSGTLQDAYGNPVVGHSVTATIGSYTSEATTTSSTGTFSVTVPTTTNTQNTTVSVTVTDSTNSEVTLTAPNITIS
jgi:hypothetical protein